MSKTSCDRKGQRAKAIKRVGVVAQSLDCLPSLHAFMKPSAPPIESGKPVQTCNPSIQAEEVVGS